MDGVRNSKLCLFEVPIEKYGLTQTAALRTLQEGLSYLGGCPRMANPPHDHRRGRDPDWPPDVRLVCAGTYTLDSAKYRVCVSRHGIDRGVPERAGVHRRFIRRPIRRQRSSRRGIPQDNVWFFVSALRAGHVRCAGSGLGQYFVSWHHGPIRYPQSCAILVLWEEVEGLEHSWSGLAMIHSDAYQL